MKNQRDEHSAGGIVYRFDADGAARVLAIKDSHGRWAFPKGRIEAGETAEAAARREIHEEVSINELTFVNELGNTQFWFVDRWEHPGQNVHKTVSYFLFRTPATVTGTAQVDERIQRVHWVLPRELRGLISYRTLRPIIERAITRIEAEHATTR
ncbi:MAG: NUDIX domain-containing protein [Patescibacteria group bacterium]|jgi:8-oxo-dGTP pyrophosphatase MutT (NUDIX family)